MVIGLLVLLVSLLSVTWLPESATAVTVWLPFFTPAVFQVKVTFAVWPTEMPGVATVPVAVLPPSTRNLVVDEPAFAKPWFLIVAVIAEARWRDVVLVSGRAGSGR